MSRNGLKEKCRYFGLQYGGQCWTGTNGSRAKSYGRVHDYYCRNKYARARNWSWGERVKRWTQSYGLGGWWTNSLHDTYRAPDIDYYGEFGYRWHRNGNTPKQPSALERTYIHWFEDFTDYKNAGGDNISLQTDSVSIY